ncbi:MAG: hypothetical protein WKG07_34850 [Hymenobacter sp.]
MTAFFHFYQLIRNAFKSYRTGLTTLFLGRSAGTGCPGLIPDIFIRAGSIQQRQQHAVGPAEAVLQRVFATPPAAGPVASTLYFSSSLPVC